MIARLEADVVVVGAGPVGLTLAMDLAWRGIDVVVLESRGRFELPSVRSNHVAARSMEVNAKGERGAERALVEEILQSQRPVEDVLREAMEAGAPRDHAVLARRVLARRLYAGFEAGGENEAMERARNHRLRLSLWRQERV